MLGRKDESEFYWQNDIKHEILRKFHKSLTQKERETDYPLNKGVDICYVLERVMKMTGMNNGLEFCLIYCRSANSTGSHGPAPG